MRVAIAVVLILLALGAMFYLGNLSNENALGRLLAIYAVCAVAFWLSGKICPPKEES